MSAKIDPLSGTETPLTRLLDHLALLCRVPPEVRRKSVQHLTHGQSLGRSDKTCIEGGENVLITLRVGKAPGVGVASASGKNPAQNIRHWHRWSLQKPSQTGECLIFGIPRAHDWDLAFDHVKNSAANRGAIAELRIRGSVYMATRREPETGLSWLSFGLHKGQSPRTTLAALGHPRVWTQFSRCMSDLLGRPITEHARPWSIAVPACQNGTRRRLVRVGSTNWARLAEGGRKSTNLANQVAEFGGDRWLAESIYGLISRHADTPRAVGVAAEYDFEEGALISAQYTLRVPQPGRAVDVSELGANYGKD